MSMDLTGASHSMGIVDLKDGPAVIRFVDAIASAFENTPLTRLFSAENDNQISRQYPQEIDKASIVRYVDAGIRASAKEGGALVEAGGMSAVAVWEIHGQRQCSHDAENSILQIGPLRGEFLTKVKWAKEKHIGTMPQHLGSISSIRPHLHLEFLGRNPNVPRSNGAVSALVRPFLERARNEKVPVWLEAVDLNTVSLYQHYGFKIVEEIVIGAGGDSSVDLRENGVFGIRAWGMIWEAAF